MGVGLETVRAGKKPEKILPAGQPLRSGHEVSDDLSMNIGQPEISAGMVVGEFLVIEA